MRNIEEDISMENEAIMSMVNQELKGELDDLGGSSQEELLTLRELINNTIYVKGVDSGEDVIEGIVDSILAIDKEEDIERYQNEDYEEIIISRRLLYRLSIVMKHFMAFFEYREDVQESVNNKLNGYLNTSVYYLKQT